jgi:hypothetical protein
MARAGVKLGFGTDLLGNAMWRIFALSCKPSTKGLWTKGAHFSPQDWQHYW